MILLILVLAIVAIVLGLTEVAAFLLWVGILALIIGAGLYLFRRL